MTVLFIVAVMFWLGSVFGFCMAIYWAYRADAESGFDPF